MSLCEANIHTFSHSTLSAYLFLSVLIGVISIGIVVVYFYAGAKLSSTLGKDSVMGKAIAKLAWRIAWMHLIAVIVMPACESSNQF